MDGIAGRILADKYRLTTKLGQGGMGSVWRAEHLALRSPVAIKLIDPSLTENPEACARFMREAQSAASLRSPHVVQILDYGVDGQIPFIAMELLEGESLAHRLVRVVRLSPTETARIIVDVCRAVGRAHQAGIVHRDLKPDNIFLVPNDESEIAKVLDFGIAKSAMPGMTPGSGTRTGAMLGTPYYMSPEQARGSKELDWRADLWALGVIVFECITGTRPFDQETLGGLVLAICTETLPRPSSITQVPSGFDDWFARALNRELAQRYQSAKELAQALTAICGTDDVVAHSLAAAIPTGVGAGAVLSSQNDPTNNGVRPFLSTTVAGAMSSTGVPLARHGTASIRWILAAFAAMIVIVGSGTFAWKFLAVNAAAPTVSPSTAAPLATTALQPPPAIQPAVLPIVSVAPTSPTAPVASASASGFPLQSGPKSLDDPRHRAATAPRQNAPRRSSANTENGSANTTRPTTLPTPAAPQSPPSPAPAVPNTNADPLGI